MTQGPEPSQIEQLHDSVVGLRSRRRSFDDRWLLITGAVVLPLGIALIIFGWYGSAQTTLDFEQTPYLISGGLLGLALVIVGASLYFGFWVTRLLRHHQQTAIRDAAHQRHVETSLAEIAASLRDRPHSEELVVTAGGTMLHRADCVATRGQVVSKAKSRAGLELCGLCRPTPTARRTASAAASRTRS